MASEKFDFSVLFRVVNRASAPLSRIGTGFGKLAMQARKVNTQLKSMKRNSAGINSKMEKLGSSIGNKMGLALTAFGALTFKTTLDFQTSMNRVIAITGATGQTMNDLEAQAKKLGATTQFSASQAADAMTFLGMAGLNAEQIMEAMPGTLQLAAAGNLELATAADIATNVMTAMGKSAKDLGKINDILAKTATSSNTNIEQLAEAMRPVAPTAESLGFSLAQVSAMLGKMADAGERGSIAGTLLRNAMLAIVKPSKNMNALFDEMGVNINDFVENGKVKDFAGLIELIKEKQIDTGKLFKAFGERGARAILLLTKKGKDLKEFTNTLENAEGTAQRMADTMMKGLPGAWKTLVSSFEAFQLSLTTGRTGELLENMTRGLAKFFQVAADRSILAGLESVFNDLDDTLHSWIETSDSALASILGFANFLLNEIPDKINNLADSITDLFGAIPSFIGEKLGFTGGGAKTNEAVKGAASNASETVVKVLVQAAEKSTATIEDVTKKKGNAKVESRTNNVLQPQLFTARGGVRI